MISLQIEKKGIWVLSASCISLDLDELVKCLFLVKTPKIFIDKYMKW